MTEEEQKTVEEKKDVPEENVETAKSNSEDTEQSSSVESSDTDEKTKSKAKGLEEPSVSKEEFEQLRNEVKDIGSRKEWLFEVRSIVSKEIKALFDMLKDLKESRDDLTNKVKVLKDDREKINADIKDAIAKIKGSTKVDTDVKHVSVGKLKKDLEKLQYYLETNPLSPDEEKKMMKVIKEKEKTLSKARDVKESKSENTELSKEINDLKDKSNEIHDEVQTHAKDSQVKHEEMIAISKEIKFLKSREKEIHQLFSEIKDAYKNKRRVLMQNRKFYSSPRKKTGKSVSQKDILKKVEENIEDKIKKGQKITTEDLLNFNN